MVNYAQKKLDTKNSDVSPGSLLSPPSPHGRGLKLSSVTALSLGERVACCRRVHQPERAG